MADRNPLDFRTNLDVAFEAPGGAEGLLRAVDDALARRGCSEVIARRLGTASVGSDQPDSLFSVAPSLSKLESSWGQGGAKHVDDAGRLLVCVGEGAGESTYEVRGLTPDQAERLDASRRDGGAGRGAVMDAFAGGLLPEAARDVCGQDPFERLEDPSALREWFVEADAALLERSGMAPCCLGWQYDVSGAGDWVSEERLGEVLPTDHMRDLWQGLANDCPSIYGCGDDRISLEEWAAHATDREWVARESGVACASEDARGLGTDFFAEDVEPDCDLSTWSRTDLEDLRDQRPDLKELTSAELERRSVGSHHDNASPTHESDSLGEATRGQER